MKGARMKSLFHHKLKTNKIIRYRFDYLALFLFIVSTLLTAFPKNDVIRIIQVICIVGSAILFGLPAIDLRKRLRPGKTDWGTRNPEEIQQFQRLNEVILWFRIAALCIMILYPVYRILFLIRVHNILKS